MRFRGEGDLIALDSHLCLNVQAAIEQHLEDELTGRYAFEPDLSGQFAAHVYDPGQIEGGAGDYRRSQLRARPLTFNPRRGAAALMLRRGTLFTCLLAG